MPLPLPLDDTSLAALRDNAQRTLSSNQLEKLEIAHEAITAEWDGRVEKLATYVETLKCPICLELLHNPVV
ncbi:hypothetical protein V5O48_016698 [Marasmius crinis-equi]|uniref:Uncharacterized protein n=1 Tax=Marasmius crinis-equi TaxID=585013 RepID=A0ABR3ER25_9AGAR